MKLTSLAILPVAFTVAVVVNEMRPGEKITDPQDGSEEQRARERILTDREGKKLRAKVISANEGVVSLIRISDGKDFKVPIARFSDGDQAWLETTFSGLNSTKRFVSYSEINEMLGQELLADQTLWDDVPGEVAQRLGNWPQESLTEHSEHFRFYSGGGYEVLGTRPHSAALYGTNGRVSRLSLVFANQGDLFDFRKFRGLEVKDDTETGRERLKDAVEADEVVIRKGLTDVLGKDVKVAYGKGANRRRIARWDWQGHAFLLHVFEDACVNLIIEPVPVADRRGKQQEQPDSVVKAKHLKNLVRRPSGDVVLSNIPMVNQGPKGYCVPATFERAMRYMGIHADMYLLANIGGSRLGGGTVPEQLLKTVGRDVKRAGRSYQHLAKTLRMSLVMRSINKGVPMMWQMYASPAFNRLARARSHPSGTRERETVPAAEIEMTDAASDYAHLTLIIGYNKKTDEIAISHSWGNRYAERWVSIKEAAKVSQDQFYVIGH